MVDFPLPTDLGLLAGLAIVLFLVGASVLFLLDPGPRGGNTNTNISRPYGRLRALWPKKGLDQGTTEEIEALLYGADMAIPLVEEIMGLVKKNLSTTSPVTEFRPLIKTFLRDKLALVQKGTTQDILGEKPPSTEVLMIVGVNGAGKTTTLGKLAHRAKVRNLTIVVGACDTFRPGAYEQLDTWCKRAGAEMVRGKEGARPSGVAYEAFRRAKEIGAHYCLIDTAGRSHQAINLMQEITKTKEAITKLDPKAPQHILLTIDGVSGQNSLGQAQEFHRALGITGLILTKCDISAKVATAISIVDNLKIPIAYMGLGEKAEDLRPFCLEDYLEALFP